MVRDPQIPVQQAILAAIEAAEYVSTNEILVADAIPKDTAPPFITVGDITVINDSTVGIGFTTLTLTIHTWDQDESSKTLKEMMAAVVLALDDVSLDLDDPNFTHIGTAFLNSQVLSDPDGFTRHGVQRFRIEVQNS